MQASSSKTMATASSHISLDIWLCAFLVLSIYMCSFKNGVAVEAYGTKKDNVHFHVVKSNSLLPSSRCKQSFRGKSTKLTVVHRYSPCIQLLDQNRRAEIAPSEAELLSQDQTRVDSIHARQRARTLGLSDETKVQIPTKSGLALDLGNGNYVVRVGLGTPQKQVTLAFDTGSDITWTQCQPCAESNSYVFEGTVLPNTCYNQLDPLFDPKTSTTYANISCSSPSCGLIGRNRDCAESTCLYGVRYGDKSVTVGFFATETLTLTQLDVRKSFMFGCGLSNGGTFGRTAGILGLGRGKLSLPSQTSTNLFSYCIPNSISSTGYLNLGGPFPAAARFTPLSTLPQTGGFYGVDIAAITVNGEALPIDQSVFTTSGGIIDSGTVITRLPPTAYSALRSKFQELMSGYPRAEPASGSLFDTCFDLSRTETVRVPKIGVVFGGGVEVELGLEGTLWARAGLDKACLAFAGNDKDEKLAIFGNHQQQGFEVVYDVANTRVGFAPATC